MGLKPHASWFPWLLLLGLMLSSSLRFWQLDPFPGKDDLALLFAVFAILWWIERKAIMASLLFGELGNSRYGFLLFIVGSLLYLFARTDKSITVELWSFSIISAGLIAAFAPSIFLRSSNFIVLAGTVVVVLGRIAPALLSSELAVALAAASATVLSATILPVVANGVTLYFGPYSATVTQECSGLNSIFSLTALAVLYLRKGFHRNPWHIALLIACLLPVAVLTNFLRVMLIVLTTWYVGDWFAQSIFHDTAGVVAFVLALALLMLIDRLTFFAYPHATK